MQYFCFFVGYFWQFLLVFKKLAQRLPVRFFEAVFGLDSLEAPQRTTNTKIGHSSLLQENNVWAKKCIFSKIQKIRFFSFYIRTFANNVF